MKNVVIIGGMAAGCKTAARLKRINPDLNITIIEKQNFLSYGTCGMPFYASGEIDSFTDLAKTAWGSVRDKEYFEYAKGVNIKLECEVTEIDKDKNIIRYKDLNTSEEFDLPYDYLVVATGSKPVKPPFKIPDTDNITDFHNPVNAKLFREKAQTGKIGSVAIIGAGFIGVELAEAMTTLWGIETHLIEIADSVMVQSYDKEMAELLHKTLIKEDINLKLNTFVDSIEINALGNLTVNLSKGESIDVDHVFYCTGIKPNIDITDKIGIKQSNLCGIKVNKKMQTNIPNIYAAGDCVAIKDLITGKDTIYPYGSLANRQGKVIADNIAGLKSIFKGAIGTNSIKIFDKIFASAGLTEKQAQLLDIEYNSVWGTWYDRPDYMPESFTLFGKMIYEKKSLRLLGLQLIGQGEVTRYIDAFSIYASGRKSAYDLLDFEHAYTPTHSSPINPLNNLGAMTIAQEDDEIISLSPKHLDDFKGTIIDVREESEINETPLETDCVKIPVSEYRKKVVDYDKNGIYLIICQKGPRSYEVARFMKNLGFKKVSYLGGGIQLAKHMF